jgi:hypothetical protein
MLKDHFKEMIQITRRGTLQDRFRVKQPPIRQAESPKAHPTDLQRKSTHFARGYPALRQISWYENGNVILKS